MFPITISFTKHLNVTDSNSLMQMFNSIQSKLKNLRVDKIVYNNTHIDFKNSFGNGQGSWHLMAPVDSGYFDYNQVTLIMKYKISTLRMFLFALAFSCIVYILSNSIGTGLFMFLWLYGANWIVAVIRHHKFFKNLMEEIQATLSHTI